MNRSETIDLTRERPSFFKAPRKPQVTELEEASYLVVEGNGAPDSPVFAEAVAALFNVAYTLKFAAKKSGQDFKVPPFEGSWSASSEDDHDRSSWQWQISLMMPDFVTEEDVAAARDTVKRRKGTAPAVTLQRIRQGLCVQMMHLGPYNAEQPSLARMYDFISESGLQICGPHHEVYIGNPQRSKPESLKTILRLPVRPL